MMAEFNPLLSVIVPVYNVEDQLPRCVESILKQTYTNFELLLINDGSKDSSGEICDFYAQKDSRVKVFHKENGGVSSARNIGIENSIGSYLLLIDSDDYIKPNLFEDLYEILKIQDFDLILFSFILKWKYTNKIVYENLTSVSTLTQDILMCKIHGSIWNKLIKRSIFLDNNIRFNETISMGEDYLALIQLSIYIKSLHNLKTPYYYYNQINENSLTKNYSIKHTYDIKKVFSILEGDSLFRTKKLSDALIIGKTKKILDLIYFSSINNRKMVFQSFALNEFTTSEEHAFSFRDKVILRLFIKNKTKTIDMIILVSKFIHELVQILKLRRF